MNIKLVGALPAELKAYGFKSGDKFCDVEQAPGFPQGYMVISRVKYHKLLRFKFLLYMVILKISDDGGFDLCGLSGTELEILDDALCLLFTQSLKREHRNFRSQILQIHTPISNQLDKISTDKEPTLF